MGLFDTPVVDHGTRLSYPVTLYDQSALDSITSRAVAIARREEEMNEARALEDIKKLLLMIGGEYGERARKI